MTDVQNPTYLKMPAAALSSLERIAVPRHGRQMKVAAITVALLAFASSIPAAAKTRAKSERSAGEIVLPFHLSKDGYPLIAGSVDVTPGVFLLDTGNSDRFLLNRNYVSLDPGVQAGGGTFASGQALVLLRHSGPHVADLSGVLKVATASGDTKAPEATLSIDARQQQENIDSISSDGSAGDFSRNTSPPSTIAEASSD